MIEKSMSWLIKFSNFSHIWVYLSKKIVRMVRYIILENFSNDTHYLVYQRLYKTTNKTKTKWVFITVITISDLSKLCTFLTEGAHKNFIITHFCSMIETYNQAHYWPWNIKLSQNIGCTLLREGATKPKFKVDDSQTICVYWEERRPRGALLWVVYASWSSTRHGDGSCMDITNNGIQKVCSATACYV